MGHQSIPDWRMNIASAENPQKGALLIVAHFLCLDSEPVPHMRLNLHRNRHFPPACYKGNVLRLHRRHAAMQNGSGASPSSSFDRRGGGLPSESSPLGIGIAYAHFRVRPGTAAGLTRFYREVLGAEAEEVVAGQNADEPTCSMVSGRDRSVDDSLHSTTVWANGTPLTWVAAYET